MALHVHYLRSRRPKMSKVYEITLESFKYAYVGFWSSIEKACEQLPNNKDFLVSLGWMTPKWGDIDGVTHEPVRENDKIKPVLKLSADGQYIDIYLPGFKRNRYKYETTPEVKEEGKPYQAEKRTRVDLEPQILDDAIARAYIRDYDVDKA